MLITVPTSAASLDTLLSNSDKQAIANQSPARINVILQNLSGNDVYFDQSIAATVAGGIQMVATTGSAAITCYNLSEISLIADGGAADIRVSLSPVF